MDNTTYAQQIDLINSYGFGDLRSYISNLDKQITTDTFPDDDKAGDIAESSLLIFAQTRLAEMESIFEKMQGEFQKPFLLVQHLETISPVILYSSEEKFFPRMNIWDKDNLLLNIDLIKKYVKTVRGTIRHFICNQTPSGFLLMTVIEIEKDDPALKSVLAIQQLTTKKW